MTDPGRDLRTTDTAATVTGLYAGAELHVGELVAQRFRIEQLLGMGGMGVVYRAFDEQLGVPVALKLLRPEVAARPDALQRFRQELLLARQVSSPYVVRIHDLVQHEGQWLISMDFVPGRSLENLIDGRGPMPVEDALRITRQLALGLAAAHQRDVVHRDLKPANVLLTDALDAYITDFGVARSIGSARMTGTGTVVGTPEYLSPEQARAEAVDHRSDLYALGLILYEMLAGRLPHEPTTTAAEMLAQRMTRPLPPITRFRTDLPRFAVDLVTRLTQLRPAHRLPDAEAVVRAIDDRRVPPLAGARARRAGGGAIVVLAIAALGYAWSERAAWMPTVAAPTGATGGTSNAAAPAGAANAAIAPVTTIVLPTRIDPASERLGDEGAADSREVDADLARALDALLVETLRARGIAAAGAHEVRRAMARLSLDASSAERQAPRLAQAFGAAAVVAPTLAHDGERWRVTLSTVGADAAKRADSGLVTLDALGPAIAQSIGSLAIAPTHEPGAPPGFPGDTAALRAYGAGERARIAFDGATAATRYAEATTAAPNFALAWSSRIEQARRESTDAAAAVAAEAVTALRAARGTDAELVRAMAASLAGNHEDALARYERLRARRPYDRALRFDEAVALSAARRGNEAAAAFEALAKADEQHGDAWLMLGREWIRAGDVQRGVDEALVRAQLAYTRTADKRGLADTAHALGVGYERLGQVDEARAQFERAAQARIALVEPIGAASSLRNLAWIDAIRGDFAAADASLDLATKQLAIDAARPGGGDVAARAALANDRGLIAEERGDFRGALPAFREALALRESLGDASAVAESSGNVGFAYGQIGEFDNAAVYLGRARDEYGRLDDASGRIRTDQSLALVEIARGDWRAARERLDRTLSDAESRQLIEEQAVSHTHLATLARLEGRIGDALSHADRALDFFGRRDDARGMTEARLIRAMTLLDVGAVDAARDALATFEDSAPANAEQAAMLSIARAELAERAGDRPGALATARGAIEQAAKAASLPVELDARILAARIESRLGEHAAAGSSRRAIATALARYPSKPHAWRAAELDIAAALAPAAKESTPSPAAARAAVDAYRSVAEPTASLPGYGRAAALHALGATALAASGDAAGATTARDLARSARAKLVESTPRELRATLDVAPGQSKEP